MDQQLHLLTGAYSLNAVSDADRDAFERYALANPDTLDEVRGLSETAALLAHSIPAETPPAELKQNVMAAIRNSRQLPAADVVRDISSARGTSQGRTGQSRTSQGRTGQARTGAAGTRRWVPVLSAAAALVVFAGVGVGGWVLGQDANNSQELQQQLAAAESGQRAMLAIMGAPDAKIATSEVATGGVVTIASSSTAGQAAVMVRDLPAAPEGSTYELWLISPAGAIPAGLMAPADPSTTSMQILEGSLGAATHVGITVEPAGGSPAPTTTPILVQSI